MPSEKFIRTLLPSVQHNIPVIIHKNRRKNRKRNAHTSAEYGLDTNLEFW